MNLAIKGHATRGDIVIKTLEMFGGKNNYCTGSYINRIYFINKNGYIESTDDAKLLLCYSLYSLNEFKIRYPYVINDVVSRKCHPTIKFQISQMKWDDVEECVIYVLNNQLTARVDDLQPYQEESIKEDKGNISDGYHSFNELYEYRLLYNASMFNELAKQGLYDVHKSRLHSDGEYPFGDSNWFIVMAELPTGQISNHYEMKDWDLFQIPIKEKANPYDGHTPQDVAKRLRDFLAPKPTYPNTYEECAKIMQVQWEWHLNKDYSSSYETKLDYKIHRLKMLHICRDAYWKIAGGWKPDYMNPTRECMYFIFCNGINIEKGQGLYPTNKVLIFPTEEMRDAFLENFKDLINECKDFI